MWAPALETEAGGKSAGVMICARRRFDIGKSQLEGVPPEKWPIELWPGRLVAARLVIPGGEVVNLYCQYLVTSSGWSRCNIDIVNKVGRHMLGTKRGEHHLIGGDWNMLPEAVAASKLPEKLGCVIAAPPAETATHISKTVANILDFFLVSRALALGLTKRWRWTLRQKHGPTGLRWRSSMQAWPT